MPPKTTIFVPLFATTAQWNARADGPAFVGVIGIQPEVESYVCSVLKVSLPERPPNMTSFFRYLLHTTEAAA